MQIKHPPELKKEKYLVGLVSNIEMTFYVDHISLEFGLRDI